MALKEGRCTNCGSLLILDSKMEKGQCLFCGAVISNQEAFAAMDLPAEHEFPNEEQPEYEGPSLAVQPVREAVFAPAVTPRKIKGKKVEDFKLEDPDIPDLIMPLKTRIFLSAVISGIFIIFLAVFLILSFSRDDRQALIKEKFTAELQYELVSEEGIAIENINNDYMVLVLKDSVSEKEAAEIFLDYARVRAEVLDLDQEDFSASARSVSMLIATPTGGYLITEPDQPEDLVLNKAMIKLD